MTYTLTRYRSYQEYLDNCPLSDGDYRLLDTGEIIQLPPEDDDNILWATELKFYLCQIPEIRKLVRGNDTELQVNPVGDGRLNRKPDVMVLRSEHRALFKESKYSAIKFGMPGPLFVAEVVSPGNDSSDNYKRDYVWKRDQYQWWEIPEYWIIDRHRDTVTVLYLENGIYTETVYTGDMPIKSCVFPTLIINPKEVLS